MASAEARASVPSEGQTELPHTDRKISRRQFLHGTAITAASVALAGPLSAQDKVKRRKPSIVFILADDLGYGELGCYGQTKIKTPNIDMLAAEGIKFTQHYSGSPVCAPSRCVLLTGKHTGHAYIRDNHEIGGWGPDEPEGQLPLPDGTVTLPKLLKEAGYATCAIGKWGLGGPGSSGHPNKQGFDHWFGYLCQRVAHNYYPTHLWRNDEKVMLEGNEYFSAHQRLDEPPDDDAIYERFQGKEYAPDLMAEEALAFIRRHKDKPFFLYYATPVPHAALQVPDDSLKQYVGQWDKEPYLGDKGYLPHPAPRAAYAAMVTRMDRDIGRLLALVKDLGLDETTIVMFSSDNGPTFNGGTDSEFFQSAGPLRGLKCSVYEGGIRVPMIARWPGKIKPQSESDHISAFWDILPTLTEALDLTSPEGIDGISMLPTLLGEPAEQKEHDYLYWEYARRQAVRMSKWKAVRLHPDQEIELYNLEQDVGEQHDVAEANPDVVEKMAKVMVSGRTESDHFPLTPPEPDQ